jgi:hypothetical protein
LKSSHSLCASDAAILSDLALDSSIGPTDSVYIEGEAIEIWRGQYGENGPKVQAQSHRVFEKWRRDLNAVGMCVSERKGVFFIGDLSARGC